MSNPLLIFTHSRHFLHMTRLAPFGGGHARLAGEDSLQRYCFFLIYAEGVPICFDTPSFVVVGFAPKVVEHLMSTLHSICVLAVGVTEAFHLMGVKKYYLFKNSIDQEINVVLRE